MRLIDAEEVKDLLLGLDSLPWEEEVDEIVDRMPTAYDVEAVVRELQKSTDGFARVYIEDAIEIVKRGGRNE